MAHVGSSELFLQDFLPEQICIYIIIIIKIYIYI